MKYNLNEEGKLDFTKMFNIADPILKTYLKCKASERITLCQCSQQEHDALDKFNVEIESKYNVSKCYEIFDDYNDDKPIHFTGKEDVRKMFCALGCRCIYTGIPLSAFKTCRLSIDCMFM